jgi:hypothetical protein
MFNSNPTLLDVLAFGYSNLAAPSVGAARQAVRQMKSILGDFVDAYDQAAARMHGSRKQRHAELAQLEISISCAIAASIS